jgi:hypothetical protein
MMREVFAQFVHPRSCRCQTGPIREPEINVKTCQVCDEDAARTEQVRADCRYDRCALFCPLCDFRELHGEHSGENLAEEVWASLASYGLEDRVRSVVTDNADNCDALAAQLNHLFM